MSTNPIIPNPTTTPTPAPPPTPSTEPTTAQLRDAAVAAQPAAVVPVPAPAPVVPAPVVPAPAAEPYTVSETPEGVEIKLETGAVYKGKTWQEAVAQVARGKVESDKTIKQMRTQQPPAPEPVPAPAPAAPAPETAEEREARMWAVAQVAKSVNMTPERFLEAMSTLPQMVEMTQDQHIKNLTLGFMQVAPDFPNTTEAADALMQVAGELGVSPTPQGLRAAHLYAVSIGKYQPITPVTPVSARPNPAPILSPSSPAAVGTPTDADLYKMPLSQLREQAIKGRG